MELERKGSVLVVHGHTPQLLILLFALKCHALVTFPAHDQLKKENCSTCILTMSHLFQKLLLFQSTGPFYVSLLKRDHKSSAEMLNLLSLFAFIYLAASTASSAAYYINQKSSQRPTEKASWAAFGPCAVYLRPLLQGFKGPTPDLSEFFTGLSF